MSTRPPMHLRHCNKTADMRDSFEEWYVGIATHWNCSSLTSFLWELEPSSSARIAVILGKFVFSRGVIFCVAELCREIFCIK